MTDGHREAGRPSRIPEFNNIEEEAEWWDTHDITDYLDELRPVKLEIAPDFHSVFRFSVRLRMEDWESLERLAEGRSAEPEELAAEWLTERVRREVSVPVAKRS